MDETSEYMNANPEEGEDQVGHVMIADDVIALIVAFAVTETEGVTSLLGNITADAVGKQSRKALSKGIHVEKNDDIVTAEVSIYVSYGYNIPEVCLAVQEKVKSAVENMTGLQVEEVNIQVAGVNVENKK